MDCPPQPGERPPDSLIDVQETPAAARARAVSVASQYLSPLFVLVLVAITREPLFIPPALLIVLTVPLYWRRFAFGRVLGVCDSPAGVLVAARGQTQFIDFTSLDSWASSAFQPFAANRVYLTYRRRTSPWGVQNIIVYSDAANDLHERLRAYWAKRAIV